jgi:hypothetical protein
LSFDIIPDLTNEIAAHLSGARNDAWYVSARSRATKQSGGEDGLGLAGGFVLGAETPRAEVDFSLPSLYHNRSPLDIRQPPSWGMLFGMAYTTPELHLFAANFTLHGNFSFYLNLRNDTTTVSPGERVG